MFIITLEELYVLLDTLIGSIEMLGNIRHSWHFDTKTRKNIRDNILTRLRSVKLEVREDQIPLESSEGLDQIKQEICDTHHILEGSKHNV